ncbi:MAG: hypothetical protein ABH950_06090 [Candidatus Altiarchaeota archaeon]
MKKKIEFISVLMMLFFVFFSTFTHSSEIDTQEYMILTGPMEIFQGENLTVKISTSTREDISLTLFSVALDGPINSTTIRVTDVGAYTFPPEFIKQSGEWRVEAVSGVTNVSFVFEVAPSTTSIPQEINEEGEVQEGIFGFLKHIEQVIQKNSNLIFIFVLILVGLKYLYFRHRSR